MIKAVSWFRRRPAMSVEEFQRYWREEHPKVVLELPGLRKYVQNHVLESQYAGGRQPFADGVAETWWDNREALEAHRDSVALANLQADELEFMDPEHRTTIVVEEVVIRNGAIPPGGGVKVITWIRRRQDLDLAAAQDYWRTNHSTVASRIPGLARYVQNHARPGRAEYEVMGLPMTWFGSMEQVRANATSPELAATGPTNQTFSTPTCPSCLFGNTTFEGPPPPGHRPRLGQRRRPGGDRTRRGASPRSHRQAGCARSARRPRPRPTPHPGTRGLAQREPFEWTALVWPIEPGWVCER